MKGYGLVLQIKKYVISIIATMFALFILKTVVDYICYNSIVDAIYDNDIGKIEKVLMLKSELDFVPGIEFFDQLFEVPYKKTPLQLACYEGNTEVVKILMSHGADVNYVQKNAVYSPLICAIIGQSENDLEIVTYLIERGANVNYQCNVKRPVISWLIDSRNISENSLEILKCLIKAGADSKKNNYLLPACYWKHEDIIIYLIRECGYSVDGGKIVQQYCRGINEFSFEIFELLMLHGADIYEKDATGKCAVDYLKENDGAESEWIEIIESIWRK